LRALLSIGLFAAGLPLVQMRIDGLRAGPAREEPLLFADSPARLPLLVPGFELVLADIYWLRTVQYYGSRRAFDPNPRYENLGALIDVTTALDPRLELAYRYGAVFLSEEPPNGAGRPADGLAVLERGVEALPGSWRLRWDLGAHWFFFMKDPRQAAAVLTAARSVPGAPFWLEGLAARFLQGDDRASAREIWRRQYEASEGSIRENALFHLKVLDAIDLRDAYQGAVARFRKDRDRYPISLAELAQAGYTRDPAPRDPTGVPLAYDAQDGAVKIARTSMMWHSARP
jgi:hypothetical protein